MAALRGGVLEYEKYPAQMLEVAGDLRRAPAKLKTLPLSRHGYLLHRRQSRGEKVGEIPEFGIPSLVLSSDLALSSPCFCSDLPIFF